MNSKKGLILFADGFEDIEGIATRDILIRGGLKIFSVSISESKDVLTSYLLKVKTDFLLNKINNFNNYDFLIIPCGLNGVKNILNCEKAIEMINFFMNNKKDVYAICAAPYILGKLGYLNNKRFTCYSQELAESINGIYVDEPVINTSEQIITAKSPAYTIDFALSILKKLINPEIYNKIYHEYKI